MSQTPSMFVSPELWEWVGPLRSAIPMTPYQRGFDDATYQRVYANPFPADCDEAKQYEEGHTDARRQKVLM
jgi:hypothetical protein